MAAEYCEALVASNGFFLSGRAQERHFRVNERPWRLHSHSPSFSFAAEVLPDGHDVPPAGSRSLLLPSSDFDVMNLLVTGVVISEMTHVEDFTEGIESY